MTSVFARPGEGCIHYRVVEEYGGSTLQGKSETLTTEPMTLGEFADFFLTAWPLIDLLEMNFEDDIGSALAFFSVDSDFYPDLDRLCRQLVREHFPSPAAGDECPYCDHFNSPAADDTCEHVFGWYWDGQFEALGIGKAFESALKSLADAVYSADEGSAVKAMLEVQSDRNRERAGLIEAEDLSVDEVLAKFEDVESSSGCETDGMLSGSGYNVCVRNPEMLSSLTDECYAITRACSLQIQTRDVEGVSLESRRPASSVNWQLVASGFWSEDMYHSGHIAYFIANPRSGEWILEGVVRKAILDGVTVEDVEEGRLNDDQAQAMWGMTLEEAQSAEYRHVVAYCPDASTDLSAKEMASVLYRAVCENGGNEISEPDDSTGLLDLR